MSLNKSWHLKHKMPKNPTEAERLKWHVAHAEHCACREMPPKLKKLVARPEQTGKNARAQSAPVL